MCGAATHRLSRSLTATPGAARRPARTVSAWAAHRPSAAWASSRSPCTVTDRTRLRPDTRSGPSAIRNSHTPARRCRSDPEPRALFVMLDRRHQPTAADHDDPKDVGTVVGTAPGNPSQGDGPGDGFAHVTAGVQ